MFRRYHSLELLVPLTLKAPADLLNAAKPKVVVTPAGSRAFLNVNPGIHTTGTHTTGTNTPSDGDDSFSSSSTAATDNGRESPSTLPPVGGPSDLANAYTPVKQAIFVMHPHGVLADFRLALDGIVGEELSSLSSWRVLSARALFLLPTFREMALWTHCVDASLPVAERCLRKGHSLFLCAGGEEEQLFTERGRERISLLRRKGFARLAAKFELPIVPVYVFGSTDLYYTSSVFMRARLWIVKKLRVCLPIFIGKYGMLPMPGNIRVVFGSPVVPLSKDVTPAAVDELHGRFVDEVKNLFDSWKVGLGYGSRELEIR